MNCGGDHAERLSAGYLGKCGGLENRQVRLAADKLMTERISEKMIVEKRNNSVGFRSIMMMSVMLSV